MIRFPEFRALARTLAAVVLSVAALGASPAAAATITISDTAFSGNQTVCPRDNAAVATPIPVNAFQVVADGPATIGRVQVRLLPAGGYANLERVEVRSEDLATLYGSIIPSTDAFWISLTRPLPASTTAASYRITIVPRRYADMPPAAAGKAYAIQAQLLLASPSTGSTVVGNDLSSATVTVDNSSPANVTWSGVTSGAAIALNWSTSASVVVMKREFAPVFDAVVAGSTYVANTTVGSSQVVFVGAASGYNDTAVQPNRSYFYKVFTRAPLCTNYSTGAEIGPILSGGTAEGDATDNTTKPVIGIVSPGNGPVTRPFKVKIRVFSPGTLPITEVRLYANNAGTDTLLGSSVGASPLITRNANYDGGAPADAASGFYEFTAPASFAAGNWTLRAWAANVASPTLANGTYSSPIGVSVGSDNGDGKLLVRDNSSQLCADCHKEQTHSAETVGAGHGSWFVGCRGCHDPHGTTNAKLIAKQITPPAYAGVQAPQSVYYTGATGNVNGALANPTGTGLCQACHNRTTVFKRGDTSDFSAHNGGQACGACHKHDKGLGASCSSCHGDPSRNVVGGDSMQAAAPPRGAPPAYATSGNAVGKHLAHVTSSTFRAALTCANCHQAETGHPNGTLNAPTFPAMGSIPQVGVWNAGASTCASTYCHAGPATRTFAGSDRTPNWLTSPAVGCQSCHQSPPTTAASYAHSATTDTDCTPCHGDGYALTGITAGARLTHINGILEQTGGGGCTGCHGGTNPAGNAAPPARATVGGLNATTSPTVNAEGAHQGHVTKSNFMPAPLACTECHPYPTGHRDGSGTVVFGTLANRGAGGAAYRGFVDSANPTCTSVYCHAGVTPTNAPNWATGTAMNCGSCHGNPPAHPHPGNTTCASCHPSSGGETYSWTSPTAGTVARSTHIVNYTVDRTTSACTSCHGTLTASGVTLLTNTVQSAPGYDAAGSTDTVGGNTSAYPGVGAHRTHLTATRIRPGGAAVCNDCHVLPPTDADTAHALDAGTGGARAAVRFLSMGGYTGTYTGSNSGTGGMTGGTCNATYCHGGKYGTPGPNWTAGPVNCGSCHGFPPASHTFVSSTMQCGSCHPGGWTTCTTANQATCGVPSNHLNGVFEPVTTTCTSCHGGTNPSANAAPPDVAIKSPVGPNAIGAHQSHVKSTGNTIATALVCDDCHIPVTQLTSANHNNGTVNTQFTTVKSAGTVWSGGAAGTSNCSASWCHGGNAAQATWGRAQGNPLWNAATGTFNTCNACHGSATSPVPVTASHHPQNNITPCAICHGTGYATTGITTPALATHVNRVVEPRTGCTACHGNLASGSGTPSGSDLAAPGYNGVGVDSHGNSAVTVRTVGAHDAHVRTTTLRASPILCSECHNGTVPVDGDVAHANGTVDPLVGGTIALDVNTIGTTAPVLTWNGTTCANTYCHGNFKNGNNLPIAWAQNPTLTCNSCHGRGTGAVPTPPGGSHGDDAVCTNCHPTDYTLAGADKSTHINGKVDFKAGLSGCSLCHGAPPTTMTTSGFTTGLHPQNATCTSCHGAGYTQPFTVTPPTHPASGNVTTPGQDAPNNGCTACHGILAGPTAAAVAPGPSAAPGYYNGTTFGADSVGSTATTYASVGAHDAHVRKTNLRSAALACTQCHYGLVPAVNNVSHSDGNARTAFDPALAASSGTVTFNGSSCSATYCHGNFPNGNDRVTGGTPTTPGQVTGLASPAQTTRSISLSWTAVTGAVLYKIERSDTVATGPFVQIGTTTATSYLDDGLWDGRTYHYRVRAWNTATTGDGTYSTTLTQQAAASGGSPTARAYNWQWTGSGSFGGLTANLTPAACPGTTYPTMTNAAVTTMSTATNTCTTRLYSGVTTAGPMLTIVLSTPYTVATTISAPSIVWNVRTSAGTTNLGTQLGYVQGGVFTGFGTVAQTSVTTTIITASPTMTSQVGTVPAGASLALRFTKVTADTNVMRFYFSNTLGITNVTETPAGTAPTLPAVPTGVAANFRVTGTTQNTVSLAWDPVANTSTYHVERGPTQTGAWTQVAEVAAGTVATTVLTDRALAASNTYYYRVIASNPAGNSSGGYTTNTVSGTTSALAPVGAVSWVGSFVPGSSSLTCTSCHGNPPGGTHPTSANDCSRCHDGYSDNTANPQNVNLTDHINGAFNVNCTGCHSTTQGTRDAVAGEFGMTWSHKRSANGRVNKWDCIVCHMEGSPTTGDRVAGVHGDGYIDLRDPDLGTAIQGVTFSNAVGANAAGNYTSTGTPFRFQKFARNLAVRLESDTTGTPTAMAINQAIMVNQCLKCHDSNGANAFTGTNPLSAMATGTGIDPAGLTTNRTASMPFGTAITYAAIAAANGGTGTKSAGANGVVGGVVNVAASFATTNSSYHPVLGRNNNGYANSTRMTAPWNTAVTGRTGTSVTVYGYLLSCWDCHAPNGTGTVAINRTVTAHGGATTVRGTPTASGTPNATTAVTLCRSCHARYEYCGGTSTSDACATTSIDPTHGAGSAFNPDMAANPPDAGMTAFMKWGCNRCHGSNYTTAVIRPVRAEDSHGTNALPANGTKTGRWSTGGTNADARPYAFIRNTTSLSNHQPLQTRSPTNVTATYTPTCVHLGDSPCSSRTETYTPGGTY